MKLLILHTTKKYCFSNKINRIINMSLTSNMQEVMNIGTEHISYALFQAVLKHQNDAGSPHNKTQLSA